MPEPTERLILQRRPRDLVLAERILRPRGLWAWSMGLLALPPLERGQALWLAGCGSVHTWGMRYPIDVLFLDGELRVLRVTHGLRPWAVGWKAPATRHVVELPAGAAREVREGDRLRVEP